MLCFHDPQSSFVKQILTNFETLLVKLDFALLWLHYNHVNDISYFSSNYGIGQLLTEQDLIIFLN